jgi:CxxC motif-containing protein (DUF1111 family)
MTCLRTSMCAAAVCIAAFVGANRANGNADTLDPRALSAGVFTTAVQGPAAYSIAIAIQDADLAEMVSAGKRKFNDPWSLRNDIEGVWGLGPTYNEISCSVCHANNGRAKAPEQGQEAARGMVVRLSVAGKTQRGEPNPHPNYGDQLQNRGIADRVPREGKAVVAYETTEMTLAGGETISLRAPRIEFRNLAFGELGEDVMRSPRIAPALVGLGLLEAIPEQTILDIARTQEKLGVSGKPNYVWDYEANKKVLGRFGWKANQPNLRQQVAAAFLNDIGATSTIFPEENCPGPQKLCATDPTTTNCGGQDGGCTGQLLPELLPSRLAGITLYLQALTVPARRDVDDPQVARGEGLFGQAQCGACHMPEMKTGDKAAIPAAAHIVIRPYTDLLLHDMGEALADGRPYFEADGREWRTPPLWGIGLQGEVSGHGELLHDGRARNVTEAILWHGGEAERAREVFSKFSKDDREALVKFVESL